MEFSRFLIGAHRGLRLRYPDNTAAGILAAGEVADFVEIDVRAAADGTLVLSHDPVIAGSTVADSRWQQLTGLDLGAGQPPAMLDDVLDIGVPLNIEIKHDPDEPGFDPTYRFAYETAERARPFDVLTSFHWPTMHAVKQRFPDLATGLLLDVTGCLKDVLREAPRHGHTVVAVHWSHLDDDEKLARVVDSGLQVVVWTVNDLDTARRLQSGGVSAIITDDPERLIPELRSNP